MAVTAQLVKELREKTGAGMLDCKKALEENNGDIEASVKWLREKGISKAAKKADRVAAEGLVQIVANDSKVVMYEVNSETDFVAKNEQFLSLMNTIGSALLNSDANTVEEALNVVVEGKTLNDVITTAIATIGEKITLRRFVSSTKTANQVFGKYVHANSRIGVVALFNGAISEDAAKGVAMHIAAMNPKFKSRNDVSADYLTSEKAIIFAEAKNDPKNASKPDNIVEKMVEGRLNKQLAESCLLDQPFVMQSDLTVGQFIANTKSELVSMVRYEVGEGIEKETVDFASEVMAQVKK